MKEPWNCPRRIPRPLLALPVLLAHLSVTTFAVAQAGDAPAEPGADSPGSEATPPEAAPDSPAATSTGASGDAAASGGAELSASSAADADVGGDVDGPSDPETEQASAAASVEAVPQDAVGAGSDSDDPGAEVIRLPESAYPAWQKRGLKGGSMWLTMQGFQWPYLPLEPGASPHFVLGLSGSAWVDTGWENIDRGDPAQASTSTWLQQGRLVVRATPTYSLEDWFVQGQAELVANSHQNVGQPDVADTDDLWVRAGQWNKWDVQVGRYEGWEVYHLGMGLDLHTLERRGAFDTQSANEASFYGVTYGYYREDTVGNVGAHLYPLDIVRIELLGKAGTHEGLNTLGGRPVGILDLGWMKFKLGGEYLKQTDSVEGSQAETERRGVGAGVQFIFEPYVEFGGSGAVGLIDTTDEQGTLDRIQSVTQYSYGGFANAKVIEDLLVGVGGHFSWLENLQEDVLGNVGEFSHAQYFLAVQYAFFGQLYLKAVGAYAESKYAPTFSASEPWTNTMYSGRLRASIYF